MARPAMSRRKKEVMQEVADARYSDPSYTRTMNQAVLLDVVRGNERMSRAFCHGASSLLNDPSGEQAIMTSSGSATTTKTKAQSKAQMPMKSPRLPSATSSPPAVTIQTKSLTMNRSEADNLPNNKLYK